MVIREIVLDCEKIVIVIATHTYIRVVHSHWSRNVEARLSLVESFIVMLRQLSYAIKNQLGHPKPPTIVGFHA